MTRRTYCFVAITFSRYRLHLIAALLVGTMIPVAVARGNDGASAPFNVSTPGNVDGLKNLQAQVKRVLSDILPAVVAVSSSAASSNPAEKLPMEGDRFATGVIIRSDGLILSQHHVSHRGAYDDETGLIVWGKSGDHVDVILHDGRHVEAELLGAFQHADLSLLRIREPGTYPFVPLAEENSVSLGEWVVKPGHPGGYQKSRGVVSRLGRVVYHNHVNVIPDCMITGGDSGGPIINLNGQILGINLNSAVPRSVSLTASTVRADSMLAFSTVSKIQEQMPTMLAGGVPRDIDFREWDERNKFYREVPDVLPSQSWRNGEQVTGAWRNTTLGTQGCVVEVLGDRYPVAYGTIVGSEGWVLTKASKIGNNPRCRLPGGEIVSSRVTGVDAAFDLAMLKIDTRKLQPIEWSSKQTHIAGTLLAAPGIAGKPVAAGIISVPAYRLKGPFPKLVEPAPLPAVPAPLMPEILGKPFEEQGFAVSFSTGRAAKLGIRPGDVISEIDGRPTRSLHDIFTILKGKSPGDSVNVVLTRDGRRVEHSLTLEPELYRGDTGAPSQNFPALFEHDIPLSPEECGGPVIGLDGKALGITIARGAYGCKAIPAAAIQPLIDALKTKRSAANEP